MVKREELIESYIKFFTSKNHKLIPSSSLVPANDPSVLFTTAGMHPLVPYLLGQKHPLGKRLVSVQKCIRTGDIEEVGDSSHHTFFEMLGNWSLGDYWKKESIEYSFEFLTKILKIPKEKLAVTCFAGDKDAPKDLESAETWLSLGIEKERIAFLPKENNWWGPAGQVGPCGPDTEIFFYQGDKVPKKFNPQDSTWVEIWNNVFMEYEKTSSGYVKAKQKNVDTGMGVERTLAALNKLDDNYLTNAFLPIIEEIEKLTHVKYTKEMQRVFRIMADHIKASVFIIADGISPSNTKQGYVLRRLIRRVVMHGHRFNLKEFTTKLAEPVFKIYQKDYPELKENKERILQILQIEEKEFNKTLERGLIIFNNKVKEMVEKKKSGELSGKEAFLLYQSYGFPIELIKEECKNRGLFVNEFDFEEEYRKHKELSRSSSAGMFKSGLADNSEQTTRLHTATHLLNQALREILGDEVKQRGSNITPERLRFDFNFPRKLTEEELKKIESLVNEKIKASLDVSRTEEKYTQAIAEGAQGEFGHKYPSQVSVYTIKDKSKKGWFSKEICTGPHVKNTKEIGKFKIIKEESVSAGVRRIKATVN